MLFPHLLRADTKRALSHGSTRKRSRPRWRSWEKPQVPPLSRRLAVFSEKFLVGSIWDLEVAEVSLILYLAIPSAGFLPRQI